MPKPSERIWELEYAGLNKNCDLRSCSCENAMEKVLGVIAYLDEQYLEQKAKEGTQKVINEYGDALKELGKV